MDRRTQEALQITKAAYKRKVTDDDLRHRKHFKKGVQRAMRRLKKEDLTRKAQQFAEANNISTKVALIDPGFKRAIVENSLDYVGKSTYIKRTSC